MGQPLPLPERIPKPNDIQILSLLHMGLELDLENDSEQFIKYELPIGWRMVDCSEKQDMPDFYIIDHKKMKRISISGSWKGLHDNELILRILKDFQITLYEL
jgi:hypothetical protein